jgi:hypothetical protein
MILLNIDFYLNLKMFLPTSQNLESGAYIVFLLKGTNDEPERFHQENKFEYGVDTPTEFF